MATIFLFVFLILIIYTKKTNKPLWVTFFHWGFLFALPKIICFFLWPLICTDNTIKFDPFLCVKFFGGQSSTIACSKKDSFSYKRGCKCVNISLLVQKYCKTFAFKRYSLIFTNSNSSLLKYFFGNFAPKNY